MLDLDQTRRFLSALSSAPDDNAFSFQTFSDKDRNATHLAKIYHGPFPALKKALENKNKKDAGIYVTVNRTDLQGREEKNVTSIRAVFVDSDSGPIDLSKCPIKPNIIVNSKAGQHAYWLMQPGQSLRKFRTVQKALAEKFGTDPSVCDPPRVMRLPGFSHNKGDPFLVTVEHCDPKRRYTYEEIVKAFDLRVIKKDKKPTKDKAPSKPIKDYANRLDRCLRYLEKGVPDYQGVFEGGRNKSAFKIIAICFDFGLTEDEALTIVDEWNGKNDPPLPEREVFRILKSAIRHRKKPIGCKLDEAYGSVIDDIPPEREDWHQDPVERETRFTVVETPPPVLEEEFPEPKEWGSVKSTAKKKVVGKAEGAAAPTKRIGADVCETDCDLNFDDIEREAREISSWIQREYLIHRDDSKCVYVYQKKYWQETSKEYIQKLAMQYDSFAAVKMEKIREAADLALVRRHIKYIDWNQIALTEVAFENGVLDFMTGELRDHESDDYLDRIIPYDWEPEASCPIWLKCLEDWFPGGDEEKRALQQFFGYILCSHAKYKKCLILYGGFDTGKSQICSIAHELAGGSRFVCGISPDEMDDPKKLAPIKGKTLNIVPDLKKNTVLADGGFKRLISTGDPIQIDQKYTRSENYIPTAKHIFATNNLPVVTDSSGAVFKRLMILYFKNQIPEDKQDPDLLEKLKDEMHGILVWAIDGAIDLYKRRGRWSDVESSIKLIKDYQNVSNPLYDFIEESDMVARDKEGRVTYETICKLFNEYHGGKNWTKKAIAEKVRALGFVEVRVGSKRGVEGLRLGSPLQPALKVVNPPDSGDKNDGRD